MKNKKSLEQEKLAMDIWSSSMYSLDFLKNITIAITDGEHGSLTVSEFYDLWCRKCGFSGISQEPNIPYHFGPIIGYLYCGILLARETWFDLLPEEFITSSMGSDWGFSTATCSYPKKPSPTIKDVFRRMRNALGHGHILIDLPQKDKNSKDKDDFEKKLTLKLHDENKAGDDTFDIEINLAGLVTAINKFYSVVMKKFN